MTPHPPAQKRRPTPLGKECNCATGPMGHLYGTVPRCEYFNHHCDACHKNKFCTLERCGFFKLGPLAKASLKRPKNFTRLTSKEQWAIDKKLGILDWDGDLTK